MAGSNLIERLEGRLQPGAAEALRAATRIAEKQGIDLYLVGGAVRDLLLDRPLVDLDLAVEKEVAPLAEAIANQLGGRLILHGRFDTAVVRGPSFDLDLARTRAESYPRPGALPVVRPASILDDLGRRDFTINAMALRLASRSGELIDPHDGRRDLGDRLVRVLHDRSYQDDATRILRTVRYAARLSFGIESRTRGWLGRDLSFLDAISGPRLRRELVLLLRETEAATASEMADALGALRAIHPLLGFDPAVGARWRAALAGKHYAPVEELGLCLFSRCSSETDVRELSHRLHLTGRFERDLLDSVRLLGLSAKLEALGAGPWQVVETLEGLRPAPTWAFALAKTGRAAGACRRYLEDWRLVKPALSGDAVTALGVPQGPLVGEALRTLRKARLEGRVSSRDEEIALVRQSLAARGTP